ncbi:MAG: hypothetical protein OXI74_17250, partial [Rhodospirillaceae bacterium]|nr:hypothetical protein [Rhodospirillaceae bacterium]
MTTGRTKLLFSWEDVDSLPDLRRLRLVLDHLPDEPVIEALRARRGRGRDDYPVDAMWRALVGGWCSSIHPWSRCCGNWGAIRGCCRCADSIRCRGRP